MDNSVKSYLSRIGRRGGQKSRRTLDSKTAKAMVAVREAKKAYRRYYARCFWSYDPQLQITTADLSWVAEQLMKHGDRNAWELAAKICP